MAAPPSVERRLRLAKSIADPALKAYLVGYLLDLIPALLKALLRFVTRETKRITALQKRASEERRSARDAGAGTSSGSPGDGKVDLWGDVVLPVLKGLPHLAGDVLRAVGAGFGPQGMASACAAAMLGWAVLDEALSSVLVRHASRQGTPSSSPIRAARVRLLRIWSCFLAAALSSGTALMVLQSASNQGLDKPIIRTPGSGPAGLGASQSLNTLRKSFSSRWGRGSTESVPDRQVRGLPTPLAPGGHFLARLTSLSIPGTPRADGSRSPTQRNTPLSSLTPTAPNPVSPSSPNGQERLPTSPVEERFRSKSGAEMAAPSSSAPRALGRPSPTVDLTLFALVRGLDTLVRAAPLFLGSALATQKSNATHQGTGTASMSASSPAPSSIIGRARSREALGDSLGTGRRLRRQQASALSAVSATMLSRIAAGISNQAEGITFVLCCAVIMWSWFYAPERLPPTYVKWITNLATMDQRLLLALRSIRNGKPHVWNYQSTEMTPAAVDMLGSLSESLGYPYEWGNPSRLPISAAEARRLLEEAKAANARARSEGRDPQATDSLRPPGGEPGFVLAGASGPRGRGEMGGIPCEIVHCGVGGSSCLANAGLRWIRGWKVCMGIYIPVHLLPKLLFNPSQFTKRPIEAISKVLIGSTRSASFLATYIASIWFMVCFGRTMVLPRLFPSISHSFWDRGLGPLMGSFACGLAIFIEERRKRAEMALYVAPRALYALAEMAKPGWLSQGERGAIWAERVVCGIAVGIVITAARFRPDFLRGVTSVMAWVVKSKSRDARLAALKA
ncbi:unnamed protein product [Parajaminaea phylloscopi]